MPAPFSYKNDSDEDKRVAPTETPPSTAEQDQQEAFDRDFADLTSAEHLEKDGKPGELTDGNVKDAENKGSWKSTYAGKATEAGRRLTGANIRALLKRRGPLALIGILGVSGGLIGTALFSPGLLIVQMKEVLSDRFNMQLLSMDTRYNAIINKKVSGATQGLCSTRVSVACKYSTMSKAQVERFRAAGIEVEGTENALGRTKPTGFRLNGGASIPASEFSATMRTSSEFRLAVRKAYNPKFAGFADSVWSRVSARIGVTKNPGPLGNTNEERANNLRERVANGDTDTTFRTVSTSDRNPQTGENYTQDEANRVNAAAEETARFVSDASANPRAGSAAVGAIEEAVTAGVSQGVGAVANVFKVTGVADTACQAYGAVQTLGYAAKTVRAIQLARYAFAFFNIADQIKEGTARAEDVAYFGGILTQIAYDARSAAQRGSATDSFGYQFAAFGTGGTMSNYTTRFLAGGGLTGDLIEVTSLINSTLGGNAKGTCATLANPWVQVGSLAGGVALMLVPGVGQGLSAAKVLAQGALQIAFSVAMFVLPELLKEIVAGTVTDGAVGADAGDGWTSGAGNYLGAIAQGGGNGPMSKEDAVQYVSKQQGVSAMYQKDEAIALSPLDPTNRYTFLGNITFNLLPFISTSGNSMATALSSLGGIVKKSFGSLVPTTQALTTEQLEASMTLCQDYDYVTLGIATDPFCNVIFGIPPQYLNRDPIDVSNQLIAAGLVDDETGEPQGEYATFVDDCIERVEPLGSSGADLPGNDGSGCKISDSNANYYLYYVDQRVEDGFEGYSENSGGSGDKQELAKAILESPNATIRADTRESLQAIADGLTDGNSGDCKVSIYLLQIVAEAVKSHTLAISDINRKCINSPLIERYPNSPHVTGEAIDIYRFDGGTTSSEQIKTLMDIAIQFLPEGSQFGIVAGCKAPGIGSNYKGFTVFDDPGDCGHIHIAVPKGSDPDYE